MSRDLTKLDPRWIFVVFLMAVCIPIIKPFGLPIEISDNTRQVYNTLESVPEGGLVVLTPDFSYDNRGELLPMLEVLVNHLFHRNVKVVSVSFYGPQGPLLMGEAIKSIGLENHGKEYGVDFVDLGYLAGDEATVAALGTDVHALVKVDYYGTPISQLPIMEFFNNAGDIDLAISLSAGMNYPELYLRQWQTTYGTRVTGGCVGLIYAPLLPYVASGQLEGYLPSLKGAAEYELLSHSPGKAIIGMDSQSLVHVVVIAVIIICNIGLVRGEKK